MNKNAVFFSTDALIALLIILLTASVIYPIIRYSSYETSVQSDIMNVLSTLKIGEINNSYIHGLISEGKITDLNKSILEQMGEFYITNESIAKELAGSVLSELKVKENVGIWFNNELLSSINSTPFENSKNIEVDRQIISGIEKGKAIKGYIAKAWLKKISKKESSYFIKGDLICGGWKTYTWGEYCDTISNSIDYKFNIPQNAAIKNATWLVEGSWVNQGASLSVNNQPVFSGIIDYYRIFDITSRIHSGENKATFSSSTGGDDGATHILIEYAIPDMQTFQYQTIFPFNEVETKTVLHYEKSIFVPSKINSMIISINSSTNTTVYIRKNAQKIFIGSKNPTNSRVEFSDTEIKNALNSAGIQYNNLSNEYFFVILDMGKNSSGKYVELGANSYVDIQSSEISMPYGTIDITQEIPVYSVANNIGSSFYRNLAWMFDLPVNSIPIFTDWQFGWLSTSSNNVSQKSMANSIILYNSPPSAFLEAFSRTGYTPERASGVFREGKNNFTLDFGQGYGVSNIASYGFLTYFIKSYVNYGNTKEKAQGGVRTIQFEDNSSKQFIINNESDGWDPGEDALDDAVERLIRQLDANNNSKVDLILDEDNFNISIMDISGVPYIWSTEVQTRRWH